MRTMDMAVKLTLMDDEKPLILAPDRLQKEKMEALQLDIPDLTWQQVIEAGLAHYGRD